MTLKTSRWLLEQLANTQDFGTACRVHNPMYNNREYKMER